LEQKTSLAGFGPIITENLHLFQCPICGGDLLLAEEGGIACEGCSHRFGSENEIALMFWPAEWHDPNQDVTEKVQAFYEENPFPNYEGLDSRDSLRKKAETGVFARLLDEQIPQRAHILEVGCGTGQLSNFLGMTWGRTVFGSDLCLNSLRLANNFRQNQTIEGAAHLQMNLFRPVFKANSFDFVISNGVLHHTGDPYRGFQEIGRLVKPGGYILIGLYNKIGRLTTDTRRLIFNLTNNRLTFLDSRLREESMIGARRRAWFMDQYKHPHESKHTIGEVQRWFAENGFDFVNAIPKAEAFAPFSADEKLFADNAPGSRLDHALVQLGLLLRGAREGGFFIMIGRKQGKINHSTVQQFNN
jgi:SAM-dependent methyltransferase